MLRDRYYAVTVKVTFTVKVEVTVTQLVVVMRIDVFIASGETVRFVYLINILLLVIQKTFEVNLDSFSSLVV